MTLRLERRRYDDADALPLIEAVQAEYTRMYGQPDGAPLDPEQLAPPAGDFVIAYLDGAPVAMGGWRTLPDGRAELKRMFVLESARGRGISARVLTHLEAAARAAGIAEMVLETTTLHVPALGLYRSRGYDDVPAFGYYSDGPRTVSLGRSLASG
ncbi:GNAT family N-acetyltransferase [Cnuibacter physcomitrellae]|uniref:GNAT family N-acetyltransferase n=1 Tax=Cnuibacter physcomitrellae TaxID=1619308 RepID=UPI0021760639|nr:GNAT family N-acetyltransferase [Cnuibacter physcomitrellae]MCS5495805.1 GNAT family N-acetyltransferase [Cnuibacter physcomitrellae]